MRANHVWAVMVGLVAVTALTGCTGPSEKGPGEQPAAEQAPAEAPAATAVATLEPKSGSDVTGTATFAQKGSEVTLTIKLASASPGVHAVHLHEFGDCSAADGSSAGGHWNPEGEAHGKWGVTPYHLGDIGNIEVGEDGTGTFSMATDRWSIGTGAENDVVGHSIIVHAAPDDFTSQPSGAAGARVACGVVELQEEGAAGEAGAPSGEQ